MLKANFFFKKATLLSLIMSCFSVYTYAQVSGTVFRDFNSNGTMDNTVTYNEIGLAGVTATAYDAAGTSVGSDISASDGTYTIAGVSGQVRVEFTGLPIGDYSSFSGGTSVQFVTVPVTGVNFAVNYPADYSQPNPTIATVIQRYGGINLDITNGKKTVYSTNYNNQFTTVPHLAPSENGTVNQTGSIWGLAYQRETKKMFISSLVKRHSDLLNDANGNEMTGNVFMTDYSGGTPSSTSLFVDVNTIGINTGTFSRSDLVWPTYPDDQFGDWICDALAINKVGKMGIGDIDISEDGADLFITNLYDRKLYKIYIGNPATTPTAANVTAYSTAPWLTNPSYTCTNGVARPFGVKYYRGKVYVGVVCTAENNGAINDLNARVFELNPATGTWTASPLITVPLNYTKGAVYEPSPGNKLGTNWNPWKDQVQTIMINPSDPSTLTSIYPQPILSDIEFDINGTMVLGFMDRNGHLTGGVGVRAPSSYPPPSGTACIADPAFSYGPYTNAMAGGDILRVGYNAATGSYTLENNATANGITTGGANNNEGPGGGEYYFEDAYNGDPSSNHKDVVQGGLATLYGYDQMLTTTFDPLNIYFSGGIQWYKNSTGEFNAGFQIYDTNNDPTSFGKANGIGDIEILSNPAPLEIGNRVWLDADADGIQDANENPIAGVTIELYAANGTTLLGTATTAADGTWYFNNTNVSGGLMPNTAYIIKVGAADWSGGAGIAQLSGYLLTSANTDGSTNGDARDSDAALLSAIPTISYTTGNYGQNDHTLDMGFKVACVPPAAPQIAVTDNPCPTGTGSFSIVTDCGTGSHIEWSIDGGNNWTTTAPTYAAGVTAIAICVTDTDNTCVSTNSNSVTTNPTSPPNCDDNNCNTADSYDTATCSCVNTPIPPPNCDDNNCNTADSYDTATCSCVNTPIPPPSCDDNNCNTADSYDTATCSCVNTPIPPPNCDDNNCNTADSYDTATCSCVNTPIPPPNCDDNNCNTADSYDTATCSCVNTPIPPPSCDDNNCNTADSYDTATCSCVNTPIPPPNCDDNNCNTADSYDTATCSCVNTPIPPPNCDDNNCNTADSYDTATCSCVNTPIPPPNCDDNNCNTADSYDTATCSCVNTPIPPPNCDDNNCNTADVYNTATCQCEHNPISPTACDDADCTTADSYNTATCQCEHTVLFTLDTPILSVTDNTCSPIAAGSINVVSGCGAGTHIEYSTDGGTNWSATAPVYGTSALTVIARCVSDSDANCFSPNSASVATAPQVCPNCPTTKCLPITVIKN